MMSVSFILPLTNGNYHKGVLDVQAKHRGYFDPNVSEIRVFLDSDSRSISGRIERSTQNNGSIRVVCGENLYGWFRDSNVHVMDAVLVTVLSSTEIRLSLLNWSAFLEVINASYTDMFPHILNEALEAFPNLNDFTKSDRALLYNDRLLKSLEGVIGTFSASPIHLRFDSHGNSYANWICDMMTCKGLVYGKYLTGEICGVNTDLWLGLSNYSDDPGILLWFPSEPDDEILANLKSQAFKRLDNFGQWLSLKTSDILKDLPCILFKMVISLGEDGKIQEIGTAISSGDCKEILKIIILYLLRTVLGKLF